MVTERSLQQPLILASGSSYRAAQLTQAGIAFEVMPPEVDESPQNDPSAIELARRLALTKCGLIAQQHPNRVVVAGDQVGDLGGTVLGKPGHLQAALAQLVMCQGKVAEFHSACAVYNPLTQGYDCRTATTSLKFRVHTQADLSTYLDVDRPFDCAGSFKIECAGPFLFEYVRADDPSALIGMPMIALFEQLSAIGHQPFA